MIFTFLSFKPAPREKTYGLTPKKKQEKKKARDQCPPPRAKRESGISPGLEVPDWKSRRGPAEKRNKNEKKAIFCRHYAEPFWLCTYAGKNNGGHYLSCTFALVSGSHQSRHKNLSNPSESALHQHKAFSNLIFHPVQHKFQLRKTHLKLYSQCCTFKSVLMKLQPYGFCMVRRPILSRDVLEDFHARISANPNEFEPELRRIFSDPMILEGLALASGQLYALTKALLQNQPVSGKDKLLDSLYKFLIRMASRCTPFGLFAGYFTVQAGQSTQISFKSQSPTKKHSRLDASALGAIKAHILEKQSISSQLLFYPNSSLYRAGESYRYIKRLEQTQQTTFILTEAAFHPALEKLLNQAKNGLLPSQISKLLQGENLSAAGAQAYVKSLIAAQILLSSIELTVTGQDYLSHLSATLSTLKGAKALTRQIKGIQKQLDQNALPQEINGSLTEILKTEQPIESTVQTTLGFHTDTAQISQKVLSKLGSQLSRIGPLTRKAKSPELEDFTRRFAARYGQQPIPLLLALDYDYGAGYGALSSETQPALPLLSGIDQNKPYQNAEASEENDLAEALYQQTFTKAGQQIMLSDALLKKEESANKQQLPPSFYVLGSLHTCSQQALDEGDFLFELKGLAGPSAGNLLTRFCPGDPELTKKVRTIMKTEEAQNENMIYAEIAHLPGGKGSNIIQRPDLRDFEIVYLAKGSKEVKQSICTADLWLSCPDGKNLLLSSEKLNKQIVPVLTSAHHYSSGLPVYRFLCDLANQNSISFAWDWGRYQNASFLPRVQFQRLVLSKASWLLKDNPETQPAQSQTAWWKEIEEQRSIPRYFTAGYGDQTLLFDSENQFSLTLLAQMLKKEGNLRITESLEKPGEGLLADNAGYFSNEFVIPFHSAQQLTPTLPNQTQNYNPDRITRSFTAGTQWLYLKIYCAERLSDALITTVLFPQIRSLEKRRIIQKWFFIRYQDPEPHIRLRFYSKKKDFWMIVFKELHGLLEPLLKSGMVQSIHSDTYQRELERYPQKLYTQIESIFYSDSRAVVRSLKHTAQDAELCWQGALWAADLILDNLHLDLKGKLDLIQTMHRQFSAELDGEGFIRRKMDHNYRAQKQKITQTLETQKTPALKSLSTLFSRRTALIQRMIHKLTLMDSNLQARLGCDLIHLFFNRWFASNQRQQEFAIYHYLKKYYTSVLKINKM